MFVTNKDYEVARARYQEFARIAHEESRKRALLRGGRFGRTANRTQLGKSVERIVEPIMRMMRTGVAIGEGVQRRYVQ